MKFNPAAHRHLFNIDANVFMYKYRRKSLLYRDTNEPLTAELINRYIDIIADSGIDTLLVNTFCVRAYYPSKTVPTVLDGYKRGDRSFFYGHILGWDMTAEQIEVFLAEMVHMQDAYLDLVEQGVDWVAETAAACRRRGIAPWLSIRMNDMHGATKLFEGSYLNSDLFKNPAMRLRGTTYNREAPVARDWMGFNYALPEVRDYHMEAIRDVVENYDYDGVELDWTRWPLCCEPNASAETTAMITDWHAEVRAMTERRGAAQGRHYAMGVKYVGTRDQMRSIGVDLNAMATRGIIDFVGPTNSWQSSWDIPCDELVRDYAPDVAVYGVVEFSPNYVHGLLPAQAGGNPSLGSDRAINYRLTPLCPAILRGNAAAKLVLGVAGLEVYNFPCADQVHHWPWEDDEGKAEYSELANLHDLEALRGQPKLYTLSSQTGYYQHVLFESPTAFPQYMAPSDRRACRIPMIAESAASGLEFVVQLIVEKKDDMPPMGVQFNGTWPRFDAEVTDKLLIPVGGMTHHEPANVGLNFTLPLSAIREGWNDVLVMHGTPKQWFTDQSKDTVRVVSVEFAVR